MSPAADPDAVSAIPEPVRWLAQNGNGRALPPQIQHVMEEGFGFDFSSVKVHDDERAAAATRSVGAKAYTLGKDIAFAPGTFQPATSAGFFLIAHELSHVVQQDGVPVSPQTAVVGESTSSLEREADQAAFAVTSGRKGSPRRGSLGSGVAQLQRFLSTEPAGGCGLCYGIPANAGRAAHALIQTEFELLYPLGLVELGLVDSNDDNGRLDLALAVPGGFEIGEIKPANERGYSNGITQIARYLRMMDSRYPGVTVNPLTKLLPPVIFPTLSSDCPVQMLYVNPPVGGVYGYFCRPSYSELLRRGCTCPPPRLRQERTDEEEGRSRSRAQAPAQAPAQVPATRPATRPAPLPANAPSLGRQILDFVQHVIAGGLNVEQEVRAFLVANPEILRNVTAIVAAIAAGAILSDILSAGTAIAKDPAVLGILAAMVRIAGQLLPQTP